MKDMDYYRTLLYKRETYLHYEDVAKAIERLGSTESTDVRNRLKKMADNMREVFQNKTDKR